MSQLVLLVGTVLLLAGLSPIDGASKRFFTDFLQDLPTPGTGGPTFDTTVATNVTGLVGKTVKLICRVKNLGNRTVSWVRHRDIHLLTVGRYTYTSDQRFEAMHSPHAEDWTLRIRYAQRKDSGIYECQISTTPPLGHSVHLNIVEPITEIVGAPELHINKGSTINLTCIVKFAPEPPPTVIWSHNRQVINFDSPRGGISLVTEKGVVTTSRLLVQKAIQQDEGWYTCTPSNANPKSVKVHIVDDNHPAAMHHGGGKTLQPPALLFLLVVTGCQLLLLHLRNKQRTTTTHHIPPPSPPPSPPASSTVASEPRSPTAATTATEAATTTSSSSSSRGRQTTQSVAVKLLELQLAMEQQLEHQQQLQQLQQQQRRRCHYNGGTLSIIT